MVTNSVLQEKDLRKNQTHLLSGKADAGASGCAACQKRRATRFHNTQAAATAVRMAAILSKLISPSCIMYPAAMMPVIRLARGIKMLSYNTI